MINADLGKIIFMKVGRHAGETFEDIVERKRREYEDAGMIFWGYGGGTMHPLNRVQPFVRTAVEHGGSVTLVMQEINSQHPFTRAVATEYSVDGVSWSPIPNGVEVRGSQYALVLDQINEGDLQVPLDAFEVAAGPSEGKNAAEYIRGRVDKGCLTRVEAEVELEDAKIIPVRYASLLKPPYAVLLRSSEP